MRLFLLITALITLSCYSQTNQKKIDVSEIPSQIDYNLILDNKIIDNIPVKILNIGNLKVPSGKIIACDPLEPFNIKPFTITVAPGNYPVMIYIAQTRDSGDRYALAKLEFSDRKAVKWILALTEDDHMSMHKKGEYTGFPVETGLGSFSDYDAFKEYKKFLIRFLQEKPGKNIYTDLLADEFLKNADKTNPDDIGDWLNYHIPDSEHNIAMFHSGYGDGLYPSYWGIDKDGNVVSLVIEFFVLLH